MVYNPQLEDGFTRLSNEWMDAFIGAKYPATVKNFVLAVARETWGWHETWREIPMPRLCALMDTSERVVKRARTIAARHNLIEWEHGAGAGSVARYRVQKCYLDWIWYTAEDDRGSILGFRSTGPHVGTSDHVGTGTHVGPTTGTHVGPTTGTHVGPTIKKEKEKERKDTKDAFAVDVTRCHHTRDDIAHIACNDPLVSAAVRYFTRGNPPLMSKPQAQRWGVDLKAKLAATTQVAEAEVIASLEGDDGAAPGPDPARREDTFAGNYLERLARDKQARASPPAWRGRNAYPGVPAPMRAEEFK